MVGDVIDDVVVIPHGPLRTDTDTRSSIRSVPGGSAANTAAWLAYLGGTVDFYGVVAAADVQRHERLLLPARAHLTGHPELPTGTIVLIIDGQRRTMLTERGANAALDLDAIPDDAIGRHLHLTGYSLFEARDDGAAFARLIARARELGSTVSVTPGSAGFIADFGVDRFRDRVAGATVLFPNLDEGRLLTGLDDPAAVAAALDFPVVALTMGAGGVLAGGQLVPAVPATVVDPTGAGDAFAAGFLLEWVSSGAVVDAARAGARAAASAVGIIGGRPPA